MDLRTVRYFIAVADAGTITGAAQALHLSQPPLSMAMSRLEQELGVILFDRKPRGIELTAAGEYLYASGRRLLEEEARLTGSLQAMGKGLEGDLRVGVEPLGLWSIVRTRLAEFLTKHELVKLELLDAHPRVQLENLADGFLDLAFIPVLEEEPLPSLHGVTFTVEVIGRLPLTLIAPSEWGLDTSVKHDLASFRNRQWIMPRRVPGVRSMSRIVDDRFSEVGGPPKDPILVPTVQTAAMLVSAGIGVSIQSKAGAMHYPGVSIIDIDGGWPSLPIGMVRRVGGIVTPIAERFAQVVREAVVATERSPLSSDD